MCWCEIWEICTKPSTPGKTSTNAPKLVKRLTTPVNTAPIGAFSAIASQGPANVSLMLNDTRPFSLSIDKILTLTDCPIAKTSPGFFTCS